MPSPFPGMNPYFEQADHSPDFHTEFLTILRRQLDPRLGPNYIVQLEKHVYLHEFPPEPRRPLGRPDVSVIRTGGLAGGQPGLGILEVPAVVELPTSDVERVAFLEVRDRIGRGLVSVIELLSPANKRPGDDRKQYLAKRREVLRSDLHLVEIDLLRGWTSMPAKDRPRGDYSVLVSRVGRRPLADYWPIHLRDRLPIIPIPLRVDDADSQVDLQAVLHETYDGPGYSKFIYDRSPEPALSPADRDWSLAFVPGAGHRS